MLLLLLLILLLILLLLHDYVNPKIGPTSAVANNCAKCVAIRTLGAFLPAVHANLNSVIIIKWPTQQTDKKEPHNVHI